MKDTEKQEIKKIHVMPEETPHDESEKCWCEPYLDYKDEMNGNEVWVHRQFQ